MFTFKTVQEKAPEGATKLLHARAHYGVDAARFRGVMVSLFGEPQLKSKDAENAYCYWVAAEDASGRKRTLTVREGLNGPEISGDAGDSYIQAAADELLRLVEQTEPADFEEELYHEDFETKIEYGCKNGECYYREIR